MGISQSTVSLFMCPNLEAFCMKKDQRQGKVDICKGMQTAKDAFFLKAFSPYSRIKLSFVVIKILNLPQN